MLLGAFRHKPLCDHMSSIVLNVYPGVGLLSQTVTMFNCLTFYETTKLLPKAAVITLHSHREGLSVPVAPHPSFFFIAATKWV